MAGHRSRLEAKLGRSHMPQACAAGGLLPAREALADPEHILNNVTNCVQHKVKSRWQATAAYERHLLLQVVPGLKTILRDGHSLQEQVQIAGHGSV